ncbi:hypothetical protein HK102_008426, partial [Quaeritorhiza haematococci]
LTESAPEPSTRPSEANAQAGRVESTIDAIKRGYLKPPAVADYATLKHFIFTGGSEKSEPTITAPTAVLTIADLFSRYAAELTTSAKDPSSMKTEGFHMAHIRRELGEGREVESLTLAEIQSYVDKRAKSVASYTIQKELQTFQYVWKWGVKMGYLKTPPPWTKRELVFPKSRKKEIFRTMGEILTRIEGRRGGMSDEERKALWEGLYLVPEELIEIRAFVRENATADWLPDLVEICVLTGCRRSEALRLERSDFDVAGRAVHDAGQIAQMDARPWISRLPAFVRVGPCD